VATVRYIAGVDRELLLGLLGGHTAGGLTVSPTQAACRSAVLDGAAFWVSDVSQPAWTLVSIYAPREVHTRQRGIATSGFAEAVDRLRGYGDRLVHVGAVDVADPPYHFQLFVDEAYTSIVACLGVDQRRD
jgi:hypothetical protein